MSPVVRGTHRPVCNWGSGDLPAPYAEGDLVRLVHPGGDEWHKRMRDVPVIPGAIYVVTTAFSIDEGDAWYFRVAEHTRGRTPSSDRLHVAYPGRFDPAGFGEGFTGCDWMAPFGLVKTVDPEGLERRTQLLADGWTYSPPGRCPTCHQPMHNASTDLPRWKEHPRPDDPPLTLADEDGNGPWRKAADDPFEGPIIPPDTPIDGWSVTREGGGASGCGIANPPASQPPTDARSDP